MGEDVRARLTIRAFRRSASHLTGAVLCAAAMLAPSTGALAQHAKPFDAPVSVKELPPKSDAEPEQVRCTYYPDMMVREVFDGPSALAPVLVPGRSPACAANAPAGARAVQMADMGLEGRKGPFLFFVQTDGKDATDFVVVHAPTGKVVLKDATFGDPQARRLGLDSAGALTLSYVRGVNLSCSILENPAACWAKSVKEGLVPQGMAKQVPAATLCATAYKKGGSPRDNPSVLAYPRTVVIGSNGDVTETAHGTVTCTPAS